MNYSISLSATNPCHLWDMAKELHELQSLSRFYSGYPRWRLRGSSSVPMISHSGRTCLTYLLNRLPSRIKPDMQKIFQWQDIGFDQWVAKNLQPSDFVHSIPGQALFTFQRARALGVRTVLNHATGPLWQQNALVTEEFLRVHLTPPAVTPLMKEVEARHRQEYELADIHCAASSVVRNQLLGEGIPKEKIWVIPYGADQKIFFPPKKEPSANPGFRIIFAGQLVLRKGLRTLLEALSYLDREDWKLECYGPISEETRKDCKKYKGKTEVTFYGAVSAKKLARAFRHASVLVLPSLEDGFGLVVPQALSCGLPCLVSDAVGAKDLIRHRENGSIFPVKGYEALAEELGWWSEHPASFADPQPWKKPAEQLLKNSAAALSPP